MDALLYTIYGTAFTCAMTTLGAAAIFFFRKEPSPFFTRLSLGFAAGIMTAASFWSLLLPAMDAAEEANQSLLLHVVGGFVAGVIFLICMDKFLPHQHLSGKVPEGPHSSLNRHQLLFVAITMHNIPEGMAVGIAFVAAVASGGSPEAISAAAALAIGMGIQNIPEGAAVTLPLHTDGMSRRRSFLYGFISGAVEPIAAIIVVGLASLFIPMMPFLLSFAAGAMIYVVVEELIPEAHLGEHSDIGTLSVMIGFVIMMILDTTLG